METEIDSGLFNLERLQGMLEKELAARYSVSRDPARKARKALVPKLLALIRD
jgi:hypothetical protein